jgi:drug/metabolite transporter (DMT)-like permease
MTSLAGVFCSILFYFKFNEIISIAQMTGMALILFSVVFLALEGMSKGSVDSI